MMVAPNTHYEVIGLGAPFIDHILKVSDNFLEKIPGAKGGMEPVDYDTFLQILESSGCGSSATVTSGGSSANTIRGLAELGHPCALVGKIGSDSAGNFFLESLARLGVTSFLLPTPTPTGQVLCLVTPDGQRTCRDFLGASLEMQADDLHPSLFARVKLAHIEGYTLMNDSLTQRGMAYAQAAGAKISFDLASFELVEKYKFRLITLLKTYVDILFANTDEARALTGKGPEEACALLKDLCDTVVVTTGEKGCWVGQGDLLLHCPAFPVKPFDTTGAGDLFSAGFLHGYLRRQGLEDCARYGALVAAEVVQIDGAEIPEETWKKLRGKIGSS